LENPHFNPNDNELNVIKALLPYAVVVKFQNSCDSGKFDYKANTNFEKNSAVFQAAEKYVPVFLFEKVRQKCLSGLAESEALEFFEAYNYAHENNTFVKPFATYVKDLYLANLSKKHQISDK
jgi:hypothetical protein